MTSDLRSVKNPLEAQIALARQGICSGSIDGAMGSQTRMALRLFQRNSALPISGALDAATKARLNILPPIFTNYTVTSADRARLQPVSSTWLGKSQQSALDYESVLELVAEKFHTHPGLVKRLNANVSWTNMTPGEVLTVPWVEYPMPKAKADFVVISLSDKKLQAFDVRTNLLAHFPCSIAARVEKRPVGELHIKALAPNPDYTFDPAVFPESAEAKELNRKLRIPPGPNNPVGVAWIGLDLPGYGIHGSPRPEDVGRTESHGCFRLANWNAEYLLRLVSLNTRVIVVP